MLPLRDASQPQVQPSGRAEPTPACYFSRHSTAYNGGAGSTSVFDRLRGLVGTVPSPHRGWGCRPGQWGIDPIIVRGSSPAVNAALSA